MRIIFLFFCFWISEIFASQNILEQENFDAWQFTCVKEDSKKICDLRGLVFDPTSNEVVSYISISINPDRMSQMQIALPHAINLKSPLEFKIDANDPLKLDYSFCNQSACFIAELIGDNLINSLKSGNQLILKVLLLDNREATITFSLGGFTAGYNKLQELSNL